MSEEKPETTSESPSKIELSNGHAILKPFVDRKTMKAYRRKLMANVTSADLKSYKGKEKDMVGKTKEEELREKADAQDGAAEEEKAGVVINVNDLDEAQEVLILNLVKKLMINGQERDVIAENLDDLPNKDYEKITVACSEMLAVEQERKKK